MRATAISIQQKMLYLCYLSAIYGSVYGLVLLGKLIKTHFENDKSYDLMVGNPMCVGQSFDSTLTCASTTCSSLSTISATNDWLNNSPFDLMNIDAQQVFDTCKKYLAQTICDSNPDFKASINHSKESEFDLGCKSNNNHIDMVAAWIGFSLLVLITAGCCFAVEPKHSNTEPDTTPSADEAPETVTTSEENESTRLFMHDSSSINYNAADDQNAVVRMPSAIPFGAS